jgi:lysyl-tRNA synthetase class 2
VPGRTEATAGADDLPEQMRIRLEKRARLLAVGEQAYPVGVDRTATLAQVRQAHPDLVPDTATGDLVGVAGRVIFLRNSGKLCFATLREGGAGDAGTELQVMISLASVGADSLAEFKSTVDLGDILFVHGEVISSRRGELSVLADRWRVAAKAIRPLPVAHKPLAEDTRVRQRYVDLIVRPQARRTVELRALVNRSLRETLYSRGFLEVETPMLQNQPGGGDRPSVRDPHECAGPRPVPAHRPRTVSQALCRGGHRPGLRDQSQFP